MPFHKREAIRTDLYVETIERLQSVTAQLGAVCLIHMAFIYNIIEHLRYTWF